MTGLWKIHKLYLGKRGAGVILVALSIAILCWIVHTRQGFNFHVVEAGQLYRSGRMSPDMLAQSVHIYGIKSVLNLEGARPERPWYREEVAELDELGIVHYDFRLSATHIASPEQVDGLIDLLRRAPKPLLVHCRDGADRSGLAAALYLAKVLNRDEDKAYLQLSLAYGHFQYLGSATEEMDDTYWATVDPVHHPD